MRKLRPPPRPFIDPPMALESLAYHAEQLPHRLPRPNGGEVSCDDIKAAAYAIAAFDPRNLLESHHAEAAIAFSQSARTCPDQRHVAMLHREVAANLRVLEDMQRRPWPDPHPSRTADLVPGAGLGTTLDARAWGYTPWQELIRDPTLRRRLGV